jgi:hypothetical protein
MEKAAGWLLPAQRREADGDLRALLDRAKKGKLDVGGDRARAGGVQLEAGEQQSLWSVGAMGLIDRLHMTKAR